MLLKFTCTGSDALHFHTFTLFLTGIPHHPLRAPARGSWSHPINRACFPIIPPIKGVSTPLFGVSSPFFPSGLRTHTHVAKQHTRTCTYSGKYFVFTLILLRTRARVHKLRAFYETKSPFTLYRNGQRPITVLRTCMAFRP